jgi:hypothetical protein
MELVALLSSSERARTAAAAWLAAFDAAWAAGAAEEQADVSGFAAWRAVVGRHSGAEGADSRMLAPNAENPLDARPPPIAPP